MIFEESAVLLISCGVFLAVQVLAFYSLHRICIALKKENQLYHHFLEQQYRMGTDCLDACREMVRESVRTEETPAQQETQEPRSPVCRRIPPRGAKSPL